MTLCLGPSRGSAYIPSSLTSTFRKRDFLSFTSSTRLFSTNLDDKTPITKASSSSPIENHTININFETRDGTKTIKAKKGEILRTAMLKGGISPHNGKSRLINCRGLGTCGTCAVEITKSQKKDDNETPCIFPKERNLKEQLRLQFPPHGSVDQSSNLRLACQVQLLDDVDVTKRSGFWGQNATDLAKGYDAELYFGG